MTLALVDLLDEYAAATDYSLDLVEGLTAEQIAWRPNTDSSAIGWHLGHQGAVNHYMVRNLTAAEVTFDAAFDRVFDSATPEPQRGDLPALDEIVGYRAAISESTRRVVTSIDAGDVGASDQLRAIAGGMLVAIINHEYQHAKWIEEVRATMTDVEAPHPRSQELVQVEGYYLVAG